MSNRDNGVPMNARTTSGQSTHGLSADEAALTVRLTEVYASVQGESTHVGRPCVFIRLTGCNLRCTWCDSTYTFTGGEHRSVADILDEIATWGINLVELTGGEPLAQKNAIPLLKALVHQGYEVLLETSGSRPIDEVPEAVRVILDLKCPDSGEEAANLWENLEQLQPHHEIKFVIASRRDYEWARSVIYQHGLAQRVTAVLLSPAWDILEPATLVSWMVDDRLPARLQLQMHKVIWSPDAQGV